LTGDQNGRADRPRPPERPLPPGPGEGSDFVKEGHLDLDGRLPLSPNGGLIGEAYIHGMNNITEAVRQIRGTAANPIEDVDHVLVSSGMSAAILGRV
jgi:acetyl-CoA acetyltransferase